MTTTKDIAKNIFLYGSPFLICMGIIKLFFFYSFFNIEITRFVSITEVLTYFIGDITFYLSLSLLTYVLTYLTTNTHAIKYKRNFIAFCRIEEPLLRGLKFSYTSKFYVAFIFSLLLYLFSKYNNSYSSEVLGYFVFLNVCYFLVVWAIVEIKRKDRLSGKLKKANELEEFYAHLILRVLFAILMYTLVEVQRVKHEGRFINTEITLDDRCISSDSTIFYIGNTNNYIFIYNKTLDFTTVYPMTRVKQIDFGDIYYFPKQEKTATEKDSITVSKTEPLIRDTVVIQGTNYIATSGEKQNLFVINSSGDTVYKHFSFCNSAEFIDFDNDKNKDILFHYLTNVPNVHDLALFDVKTKTFKLVDSFSSFPTPVNIVNTKYFYSYHRSGCADSNWDSDLFYIDNFKTYKIGNIAGRECNNLDEKDGIYINKVILNKTILYKTLPITTIAKYKDDKWGFIADYWEKNYKVFVGK